MSRLQHVNFGEEVLSAGIDGSTTSIVLSSVASLPSTRFWAIVWNATDYALPGNDPDVEIILVTAVDAGTKTLTVVRGRQNTSAVAHNAVGKTYHLRNAWTAADATSVVIDMEREYGCSPSVANNGPAIAQAIADAIATGYGACFQFGPGSYGHDGITIPAGATGLTFRGVNRDATELTCTADDTNCFTVGANANALEIADMTLRTTASSRTAWGVYSFDNISRNIQLRNVDVNNFERGVRLSKDLLDCILDNVRFNGPVAGGGKSVSGSIALEAGTGAEGGNGMTLSNVYISSYAVGIDTHVALANFERVMIESCGVGLRTNAAPMLVLGSWAGSGVSANDTDININGNGILLIGYGSSSENITYVDASARNRSIMFPERLDATVDGDAATKIQGAHIGRALFRNYGSYQVFSLGRDDRIGFRSDPDAKGLDNGPVILSGSGAPSATVPDGSLYLRTDPSAAAATLYVRYSGGWYAVTAT